MVNISVVIHSYNEENNVNLIINRIDAALIKAGIQYEIIWVDDNSTDHTEYAVRSLTDLYPVKFFNKKGKKGKTSSLIEGFSYASGETIAVIDADMRFPPELIPEMYRKLSNSDIVNADSRKINQHGIKGLLNFCLNLFIGKLVLNYKGDIVSGIKLFKSEIIRNINLTGAPWTFDLEFMMKARNAGFKITSYNTINHNKKSRESGSFSYHGKKYTPYNNRDLHDSAFFVISKNQKIIFFIIAFIIGICSLINWRITVMYFISFLTLIYFYNILFNLFLVLKSIHERDRNIQSPLLDLFKYRMRWPSYTILCPLYKEVEILPQFVSAITSLDYPKDKLQVLLLLEETDNETINEALRMQLPPYINIAIVPDSTPRTKPKACNFGLRMATGSYLVIYDAEDIPEKDQLKKSVVAFESAPSDVVCLQAKLDFYNTDQNVLTRLFTLEYTLWFDTILVGLQSINAPIPLGGTSNHFKTDILKRLNGWDPFNVTEDCDLGIRLAENNLKTAMLDSATYEEANSVIFGWIKQRSR